MLHKTIMFMPPAMPSGERKKVLKLLGPQIFSKEDIGPVFFKNSKKIIAVGFKDNVLVLFKASEIGEIPVKVALDLGMGLTRKDAYGWMPKSRLQNTIGTVIG